MKRFFRFITEPRLDWISVTGGIVAGVAWDDLIKLGPGITVLALLGLVAVFVVVGSICDRLAR